nr:micrococcal nuclease-like protein [uncultured bacterium]
MKRQPGIRAPVGLLLVISCVSAIADEKRFPAPDECGDPTQISTAYLLRLAEVVEVLDGDTLKVVMRKWRPNEGPPDENQSIPDREPTVVQLVCLDAPPLSDPIGRIAQQSLSARLLGKEVRLLISHFQEDGTPTNVMLKINGGHDIDEGVAQLEQGLARYRDFGPYDLDWWTKCHYQKAEQRARQNRAGIWAN